MYAVRQGCSILFPASFFSSSEDYFPENTERNLPYLTLQK